MDYLSGTSTIGVDDRVNTGRFGFSGHVASASVGARSKFALGICLVLGVLLGSAHAQDWRTTDKECTEYLATGMCHVTIRIPDIAPGANPANAAPTHADITLQHNSLAGVILTNASPLMSCSLAATPAPLTRDASSSITTFISTLATLGLPASALGAAPAALEFQPQELSNLFIQQKQRLPAGAADDAKKIEDAEAQAQGKLKKPRDAYDKALADYQHAQASVLAHWKYHYSNDDSFTTAATQMYADLRTALADPLPSSDDFKELSKSIPEIEKQLEAFNTKYQDADSRAWYETANMQLSNIKSGVTALAPGVQFLNDLQALLKPAFTWLNSRSNPAGSGKFTAASADSQVLTTIYLPMSLYAQKQVTETITCKDVASKDPAFDNITFTAFYEPAVAWDFSAAAFFSLVPGRQLGTYTQFQPLGATIAGPNLLAATTQSSHQFIPGAVFELHPGPLNRRCPWVKDWPSEGRAGTGYHPWGYVCSIGPAVGFLVNPNNGSTQAEFFEGISLGIHRFAILIGNHTGRYQEFAEGYAIGQTAPSGTTPATTRRWTNHPAVGIAFRIPIR